MPGARRPACLRCERPAATCLCATLPAPIAVRTRVLILQHPDEARHAKNTTAFLTLGLAPAAQRLRGEVFDAALATAGSALLYPGTAGNALAMPGGVTQLILLDGSWRQSRRLLAANPWLAGLPRVSLPVRPSRYALRRAHRPGQLATLEAGLHALAALEGEPARFEPLWAAFDGFVRKGLSRRGD